MNELNLPLKGEEIDENDPTIKALGILAGRTLERWKENWKKGTAYCPRCEVKVNVEGDYELRCHQCGRVLETRR